MKTRRETKQAMNSRLSHGVAEDNSPRREPWEPAGRFASPGRGDRSFHLDLELRSSGSTPAPGVAERAARSARGTTDCEWAVWKISCAATFPRGRGKLRPGRARSLFYFGARVRPQSFFRRSAALICHHTNPRLTLWAAICRCSATLGENRRSRFSIL